jgi:hypothetical protein
MLNNGFQSLGLNPFTVSAAHRIVRVPHDAVDSNTISASIGNRSESMA